MSILFMFALPRYLRQRSNRHFAPLFACVIAIPAFGETITGQITFVRDVDTLVVDRIPVRLNGVDGPELHSPEGQAARLWMIQYVSGQTLRCDLNGHRSHDRHVGVCYANGQDIGAAAIQAGHALDCQRFSDGRYKNLETDRARMDLKRAVYC